MGNPHSVLMNRRADEAEKMTDGGDFVAGPNDLFGRFFVDFCPKIC